VPRPDFPKTIIEFQARFPDDEACRERKLDIQLVTVSQLLRPEPEQVGSPFPKPASVLDMPLPPARPREARPSAEELARSDRQAVQPGALRRKVPSGPMWESVFFARAFGRSGDRSCA
jgi:hypothetical protein